VNLQFKSAADWTQIKFEPILTIELFVIFST